MKRHEQGLREFLDQSFARFRKLPPDHVESACERVLDRLRENPEGASEFVTVAVSPVRPVWRVPRFAFVVLAIAVLLSIPFVRRFVSPQNVYAVVVTVSGSVDRVADGESHAVSAGEKIDSGKLLRTNGKSGLVFDLPDGTRVEMNSNSEVVLEHENDGVLLRLNSGSVIVTAARQRSGRLYVRTKDAMVSVVNAVLLVSAEPAGTHVAVFQKEAVLQQGATKTTLHAGEQVATNPSIEANAVSAQISWSESAPALLALWQQATAPTKAPDSREIFEVVSIRPSGPRTGGGGRGGGEEPCSGSSIKIDPHRFAIIRATLYNLITVAYGLGGSAGGNGTRCSNAIAMSLLSGGPDWVSDQFDIQAVMLEGSADFTSMTVGGVSVQEPGPRIQRMLQNLLADRFKLFMHREMKEVPVYVLSVAKGGPNLTEWKNGDPVSLGGYSVAAPIRNGTVLASVLSGAKASMAQLAGRLEGVTNRPVLDRSGVVGDFNYRVEFSPPPDFTGFPTLFPGVPVMSSPSLFTALKEQLGLELKPDKAPIAVLVIDHVEKPSEN